jgi:hypothetical protein
MEVAGADLSPGVGDADDGLLEVFFGEANAAKVRASGGAVRAVGEDSGMLLWIDCAQKIFLPLVGK